MASDTVAELAQKLYEDDGHSGSIYRKAPIHLLRFYENKALEIIETRKFEPSYQHLKNILGVKDY